MSVLRGRLIGPILVAAGILLLASVSISAASQNATTVNTKPANYLEVSYLKVSSDGECLATGTTDQPGCLECTTTVNSTSYGVGALCYELVYSTPGSGPLNWTAHFYHGVKGLFAKSGIVYPDQKVEFVFGLFDTGACGDSGSSCAGIVVVEGPNNSVSVTDVVD
jgi:hypothetical protein